MSHATFTVGRFNPPTETGHGKLISAVKDHAESKGGAHYVFPTRTQDKKKNPLRHDDKVHVMSQMFPNTNIVSHSDIHNVIHAMKHMESKGHKSVTMVAGSDRVDEFHKLLNAYNGKEYNFKKIHVKSAGQRDPDAAGSEGMSASKLRGLVTAGKKKEFVSHYSDKKLGAHIHDKVKAAMSESKKAMFIIGGPGSGKDYVINNILSRFSLVEVQLDQILNGSVKHIIDTKADLLINGNADVDKIQLVKSILEGYEFHHTHVFVANKVSRLRNECRKRPLKEQVRIRKWLDAKELSEKEKLASFIFDNSLNLREATESELKNFETQIGNYLEYIIQSGFVPEEYVRINAPEFPHVHMKEGRVFYHHEDGRVNVQVDIGDKQLQNYILRPEQYVRTDEVLEYGTDETTANFKANTPGQLNLRPKLTIRKLKKGLIVPPKSINARIDGAGGYSMGGAGAGSGLAGLYNS